MPPIVDEAAADPSRSHRRRRPWFRRPIPLTVSAVIVIVVAGVLITWAVAANSWYVARDGRSVALYHGIQSAPLGVSLSSVEQRGAPFDELLPVDQQQVRTGIVADSKADGVCILARLRKNAQDAAYSKAQKTVAPERSKASATPSPKTSSQHPSTAASGKASGSRQTTVVATTPGTSPAPRRSSTRPTPKATPSPTPTVAVPSPTPLPASCPP
jgi:hypothetical protein